MLIVWIISVPHKSFISLVLYRCFLLFALSRLGRIWDDNLSICHGQTWCAILVELGGHNHEYNCYFDFEIAYFAIAHVFVFCPGHRKICADIAAQCQSHSEYWKATRKFHVIALRVILRGCFQCLFDLWSCTKNPFFRFFGKDVAFGWFSLVAPRTVK